MNYLFCILGSVYLGVFTSDLFAQSVGVGTNDPSANAALHIVAPNNNQGILIPSLTTEQRLSEDFVANLSSQDNGLLIFDLTEKTFYFWSDTAWMPLVSGSLGQLLAAGTGIEINQQNEIVNIGDADSTNDITIQTEAAGDLTGLYPAPEIAAGVVDTDNLADSAVVGEKIADNTIEVTKLSGLANLTLGRNSLLITNNSNTPRWFQPSLNQVIVTDNAGQITSRPIGSFTQTTLPEGNIFIGDANGDADVLDASNNGRILVGNGTSLVSVDVMGDISLDGSGNVQLTTNAVTSGEIADGTISTADLADQAITSDKILDGTIVSADLSADAVSSGTITNETILNEDISASAGIQVAKLETMATGTIVFGNAGVPTVGTLSGDASIDGSGVLTLNALNSVDINGGTIDGTPIGAVTPSSGNFSTLTATDGSGITNLSADNLALGTVPDERLPDVGADGTFGGGSNFIESITVDAKGRVTAVTANPPASDRQLKENLQALRYSLQDLNRLQAYRYNWKEARFGTQPQIGLIAQDVEKVFPELVQTRSDGYKGVHYQGLIPVLIEAAKAQQHVLSTLEEKNQSLQNRISELEGTVRDQSHQLLVLQQQIEQLLKQLVVQPSPSVTEAETENVRSTNR